MNSQRRSEMQRRRNYESDFDMPLVTRAKKVLPIEGFTWGVDKINAHNFIPVVFSQGEEFWRGHVVYTFKQAKKEARSERRKFAEITMKTRTRLTT